MINLLILLCFIFQIVFSLPAFSLPAPALSTEYDNAIPVTVKALQQLVFHPLKKAPAQVVTLQNSLLSSEISALVKKVHVQVGDKITKDQLLVTLECDDYELNKQQLAAEKEALTADYQFAVYQFERSEKLLKNNNVSQELYHRQEAGLKKLAAQIQLLHSKIKQADNVISRCRIKAPFNGVVAQRLINRGENTAPRTPLIQLIDVDNLEVEVQVPIVVVDDLDYKALDFIYRKQRYPVAIRAVIPSIETRARHQRVRLSFVDKKALPDAFGVVEITKRELHIPANYLLKRNTQVGLFVLQEITQGHNEKIFKARFYALKDALIGRSAMVDLPLNSQIIIEGRHALNDGDSVIVQ